MSMTNPLRFTLDRSSAGKAPPGVGGSKGTCVPGSKLPHVPSRAHPQEVMVLQCRLPSVIQAEELWELPQL